MTRSGTAIITAVDRKAGTVTVERVTPWEWKPDTLFMHPQMFRALQDELRNFEVGDPIVFGVTRTTDVPARLAGCRIGRAPAGNLSAPPIVALTTLCAMEWLRHRKQAVAAAEASGDYSSLIEEFVAWLRALFAEWRAALASKQPLPALHDNLPVVDRRSVCDPARLLHVRGRMVRAVKHAVAARADACRLRMAVPEVSPARDIVAVR